MNSLHDFLLLQFVVSGSLLVELNLEIEKNVQIMLSCSEF